MGDPSFDPQDAPQDPPSPGGVSPLVKLYLAHRAKGLSDVEAAQATAASMRGEADLRGSMRDALDLFRHKPMTGDAYRAQLMGEADQPIKDVQQRNAASDEAMKNTLAQGKLQGTDFENQQIQAQMDPNGEESRIARESLSSILPNVAKGLGDNLGKASAYQLYKAVPQLKEMTASRGALAGAGAAEATANKIGGEAAQVAPNAAAERKLKGAQTVQSGADAEKARAEAAHQRMLTGGEVVPGYSRGSIPIDGAEATKINDEYKGNLKAKNSIDEILKIVGDSDWVADSKRRAQLQPRLASLIGDLRGSVGIQRLAGPEMEFAKKIIADPTAWSASNMLGLNDNKTRFRTMQQLIDNSWDATVRAKDLRKSGAGQPQPGATTPNAPRPRRTVGGETREWDGKAWVATNG